jgi:NADH dehydrogenase (ubiquinone) 1 alpha subcomplex subunit 8
MGVAKESDPTRGAEGQGAPTSALLMAASKHIALSCARVNEAYIQCRDKNHNNPTACLKEGEAVTGCVVNLLSDLNKKCPDQLRSYCECMDYYSNRFSKCRKEQAAFEECAPL